MSKDNHKGSSFGNFVSQLQALILGLFGVISAVVGFIKLVQGNAGLITLILLALGIVSIWLVCFYFTHLWKPESSDGNTKLILPASSDRQIKQQNKKVRQRKLIRRSALAGLIMVPLLTIGSWATWVYVQNLPNDVVVILVADFDGPNEQSNRFTETILRELRNATEEYEGIEVSALGQSITEQAGGDEARRIAEKKKADIVIWGWYGQTAGIVPISANFEILESYEHTIGDLSDSADGAVQTFDIAELDSFQVQTKISAEMSYLTLFTLGVADYVGEDWDRAINRFDNALIQTEDAVGAFDVSLAHYYQGNSFFHKKEFELAIDAFDQTLEITQDFHPALYNKGLTLAYIQKYDEAIIFFDKALGVDPDDYDALSNKGIALRQLGQYDEAINLFDKALDINPEYYKALNNKGNALVDLGRYDEAIENYDETLKIKPDFHDALYNKGNALTAIGQHDEAITSYDEALTIRPDDYEAHNGKGSALARLERYDEAIISFDESLTIKPDYSRALLNKGTALVYLERYSEALASFDKALMFEPNNHEALLNKAWLYSLQGNTNDALNFLEEAIILNDDYRNLAKNDIAFDNIRQDPRFQELINTNS